MSEDWIVAYLLTPLVLFYLLLYRQLPIPGHYCGRHVGCGDPGDCRRPGVVREAEGQTGQPVAEGKGFLGGHWFRGEYN